MSNLSRSEKAKPQYREKIVNDTQIKCCQSQVSRTALLILFLDVLRCKFNNNLLTETSCYTWKWLKRVPILRLNPNHFWASRRNSRAAEMEVHVTGKTSVHVRSRQRCRIGAADRLPSFHKWQSCCCSCSFPLYPLTIAPYCNVHKVFRHHSYSMPLI